MKIVVLGYGKIAQSVILGILQTKHELVGVMRWEKERPNPYSASIRDFFVPDGLVSLIESEQIPEIRAKNANSKRFKDQIKELAPDVIIVGSWGEILKQDVIDLPKIACINCHPSMLPRHRGSNPYVSTIRHGEKKTGITFHLIDKGIDTGDILLQEEVQISIDDNAETLKQKCAFTAKLMIPHLLDGLEKGKLLPKKQNEVEASYFPPINEDDVVINWSETAESIHNQIRAFSPKTGCYTLYNDDFLFIKSSKIVNLETHVNEPGKIIEKNKNGILVSTGNPAKAIFAGNIEFYGFLSKLWSKYCFDKKLKENTCFTFNQ